MATKRKKITLKYLVYILLAFVLTTVVVDVVRISNYEMMPKKPLERIEGQKHDQIQYDLANGKDSIDWSGLDGTLVENTTVLISDW